MKRSTVLALIATVACVGCCLLALRIGPKTLSWSQIVAAVLHYDPNREADLVLLHVRLPRVLLAGLVGSSLAVSGAIMQALTRNPLASPTLTGFNGGASLALLVAILFYPSLGILMAMTCTFLGGLLGMALVFGICAAAPGGLSPTRLALAGIMVSATLGGISSGIVNYFQLGFEQLYWSVGGLCAVEWSHVGAAGGVMALGYVLTAILTPHLDPMRLGDEIATGLGLKTRTVFFAGLAAATLLAGSAVAVAGPVAFVGLMAPHIARAFVGGTYERLIPTSAGIGALVVVWADSISRVHGQGYYPMGVFLTLIGSVFFLFLAARKRELQHV